MSARFVAMMTYSEGLSKHCLVSQAVAPDTHLHVAPLVETVHLVQQLQQDALYFAVGTRLCVETFRGNGVDLVNEDNRWGVFPCESEYVADHAGSFAEVLLHEL